MISYIFYCNFLTKVKSQIDNQSLMPRILLEHKSTDQALKLSSNFLNGNFDTGAPSDFRHHVDQLSGALLLDPHLAAQGRQMHISDLTGGVSVNQQQRLGAHPGESPVIVIDSSQPQAANVAAPKKSSKSKQVRKETAAGGTSVTMVSNGQQQDIDLAMNNGGMNVLPEGDASSACYRYTLESF